MSSISILIPTYNDLTSLRILLDSLAQQPDLRTAPVRIVVIDDGSSPPVAIDDLARFFPTELVTLRRNVGHQRAIAAGLAYEVAHERSSIIVIMDGDGEDRPEDVPRLLATAASADKHSIVVAERSRRSEGLVFAAFYHCYRLLFFVLVGEHIRFGNFCAMQRAAASRLVEMNELWLSLPATILRSRAPIVRIPTARGERYHGPSRMDAVALVTHGLSAVAVFMQRVLTRVVLATLSLVIFCIIAALAALLMKLFGAATPGWLTTVVGILFVVLVSTGSICLVGLFIGMTSATSPAPAPCESGKALVARVTISDGEADDPVVGRAS